MAALPNLAGLSADLAAGRITSGALVEQCLARATDPDGEGHRVFIKLWEDDALAQARAHDRHRKTGVVTSAIAGIPISIKDLFDVAGETTRAGSKVLADAPPAIHSATVVRRLKAAGAILIGRTNMAEFAFSGVGLNPHYGTPGNPWDRARVPGGSSSGAAVSVSDGMAAAAIGSDTGGSVRIPAALCGLAGFKPTQKRVPLDGVFPLSTTLDSVGPIARTVTDCVLLDQILSDQSSTQAGQASMRGLRFAVPNRLVLDDLDAHVASTFERALGTISRAGACITHIDLALLNEIVDANRQGGFPVAEAWAQHQDLMTRRGALYDPHARERFTRGATLSASDYVRLCWKRASLIERATVQMGAYHALLVPTCPVVAPRIDELEAEDTAFWLNNALLPRNTALFNFLDCCAATVPIQRPGELPVGLMLVGRHLDDHRVLAIAQGVEAEFYSEPG
ncbi:MULTISPECIES: amidase [unclassified Caballeronia]|uniref:amidase n=1 Tax=unclassified Caballeronia TaxID=2646786 RepID=UPI001F43D763|nr:MULTISPECIES: amidase [unclassified Caballeronia]MCE4547329.1 amidase [Caballeronia sp. PC1]MCE4575312.1 amidase [Caballeronia sp. CLC5]